MKIIYILLTVLITRITVYCQEGKSTYQASIGGSYNFQTEGKGGDIRLMFPIASGFYLTPRLSYFPSSNVVNENYSGIDFEYYLLLERKITPYIYIGGYYDDWINSKEFNNRLAKEDNFVEEGGGGLIINLGCFNPYIEYRYDAKWEEGSIGVGVLVNFTRCFGSKIDNNKRCPQF